MNVFDIAGTGSSQLSGLSTGPLATILSALFTGSSGGGSF